MYTYVYIHLLTSFFLSFFLNQYLTSLKPNDNLPISGHRKIWILQSVE